MVRSLLRLPVPVPSLNRLLMTSRLLFRPMEKLEIVRLELLLLLLVLTSCLAAAALLLPVVEGLLRLEPSVGRSRWTGGLKSAGETGADVVGVVVGRDAGGARLQPCIQSTNGLHKHYFPFHVTVEYFNFFLFSNSKLHRTNVFCQKLWLKCSSL